MSVRSPEAIELDASDPTLLVESFAGPETRVPALHALQGCGPAALPAVREGLRHPNWHVRHWCALYMDRNADLDSLRHLVPLLSDPVMKVRLWAVHSLACEHCKGQECPIDVVPLLIERVQKDSSVRVRKMAVAMLASLRLDARVESVLRAVAQSEQNLKIKLHAEIGLRKYSDAPGA
jgi:hypothetical protein